MKLLDWVNSFGFNYEKISEIKDLSLSNKEIESLHPDFYKLKLYHLNLWNNKLKSFHYKSKCLRSLNLMGNPLEEISLETTRLNTLRLSDTKLHRLELKLESLKKLFASSTSINSISLDCPELYQLSLVNNPQNIRVDFLNIPEIEYFQSNACFILEKGQESIADLIESYSNAEILFREKSLLSEL